MLPTVFLALLIIPACSPGTPVVKEIKPVYGLLRGGEKVVVEGTSLDQLAPVSVYFGSQRVETSGFDRGNLWVTLPAANETGVVDVRIIGADGTEFLLADGFEYVRSDKMAECVNIGRALNGKDPVTGKSKQN